LRFTLLVREVWRLCGVSIAGVISASRAGVLQEQGSNVVAGDAAAAAGGGFSCSAP
jgi:hypothetical protein